MKAIFVVPTVLANAVLPPMQAEAGKTQLLYTEGGVLKGGFSLVGNVPNATTCIVLVESSPATIAAMQADPQYLFVEEVIDAPAI